MRLARALSYVAQILHLEPSLDALDLQSDVISSIKVLSLSWGEAEVQISADYSQADMLI